MTPANHDHEADTTESDIDPLLGLERPWQGTRSVGRRVLVGGVALTGAAIIGGAGYKAGEQTARAPSSNQGTSPRSSAVVKTSPFGEHQQGVGWPQPRQAHVKIIVADLRPRVDPLTLLAGLGQQIAEVTHGSGLAGFPPAGLTITVGLGPGVVKGIIGPDAPGAAELPRFRREEVAATHRGGDLLVQICVDDPTVAVLAEQAISCWLSPRATLRWHLAGFRGAVDGTGGRNLLGFYDGLSVPKTPGELDEDVWLDQPRVAGGTIAVVRRMPIDIATFNALPLAEQEAAIGRRRDTGEPLSGGTIGSDPNLSAKTPEGDYKIAVDAHVRRAHPLPSGADGLMLRRSYSYACTPADQGLIFISFQKSLQTFVRTQRRMDESDALMSHSRTTASGSFLILPGYTPQRQLGESLRS